jgi:hypothetical protein
VTKVIQVRDVPDDVHAALTAAAKERRLSLTGYLLNELEYLASHAQIARSNADVIRQTQKRVRGLVSRQVILAALDEGREE